MDNTRYAARREHLRALMRREGLDALIVSHPANRFYLSGFELHDSQCNESSGCLIIRQNGRDWLCTDSRYEEAAASSDRPGSRRVTKLWETMADSKPMRQETLSLSRVRISSAAEPL